jgi:signal-transduction protein with cAMP-binding, CBS, and nucleotidyltransferase domain
LARVTLTQRQEFLAGAPLFADLKKGQLGRIAKITKTARFKPVHEIVIENESGDFCSIIVEGTAEVTKRGFDKDSQGFGSPAPNDDRAARFTPSPGRWT